MIKNKIIRYKHSKRVLNQLLRLYERNYLKLLHLFPIERHEKSMVYLIPEGALNKEIKISCKKLSRHTSVLKIFKSKSLSLLQNTEIEIYIYHDAKMAEVRKFNGKRQFWLRNKYPNKNMLSKDEKFQWNFFLDEFLNHTKKHGLSILKHAL